MMRDGELNTPDIAVCLAQCLNCLVPFASQLYLTFVLCATSNITHTIQQITMVVYVESVQVW